MTPPDAQIPAPVILERTATHRMVWVGEVYFFNVRGRPVGGHGLAFKDGKRIFAELAHPFRIVLDVADVVDGGLRQAVAGVEFMAFREGEVPLAPVEVKQVLFVPVL